MRTTRNLRRTESEKYCNSSFFYLVKILLQATELGK